MNLENQKEKFKNHIAKFSDYGNIKILDFKNLASSDYRIRFLFEEDYCKLHISGDLGELTATNYNNMTFNGFLDFVNNADYFEEKIDCHSRYIYAYDENLAREELKKRIEEDDSLYNVGWRQDEEFQLEAAINDILTDFSDTTGIGTRGYDKLWKLDYNAREWAKDLGKRKTGILELYMLAFKLAMEQLEVE